MVLFWWIALPLIADGEDVLGQTRGKVIEWKGLWGTVCWGGDDDLIINLLNQILQCNSNVRCLVLTVLHMLHHDLGISRPPLLKRGIELISYNIDKCCWQCKWISDNWLKMTTVYMWTRWPYSSSTVELVQGSLTFTGLASFLLLGDKL